MSVSRLISAFQNPQQIIFDRAGLKRNPYLLRTRDGLGIEIRPGGGDRFTAFEVFALRTYTSLGERLHPGSVVVDIGANIGCYALMAARAVGTTGRVVAIEPSRATFLQLTKNIALNRLGQVACRQVAVAGEPGIAQFHINADPLFSSLYPITDGRRQEGATETVNVTTLREIIESEGLSRIDMLKMDCEGAEHDIIKGFDDETASKVAQISLEIHAIPGNDGSETIARLEALGYRLHRGATYYFDRP